MQCKKYLVYIQYFGGAGLNGAWALINLSCGADMLWDILVSSLACDCDGVMYNINIAQLTHPNIIWNQAGINWSYVWYSIHSCIHPPRWIPQLTDKIEHDDFR